MDTGETLLLNALLAAGLTAEEAPLAVAARVAEDRRMGRTEDDIDRSLRRYVGWATGAGILGGLFVWDMSEQGHKYWADVDRRLMEAATSPQS